MDTFFLNLSLFQSTIVWSRILVGYRTAQSQPLKYNRSSFSAPSSDADSTLKKRSRNKTLEDVIDAVRAEIAKADDSGRV